MTKKQQISQHLLLSGKLNYATIRFLVDFTMARVEPIKNLLYCMAVSLAAHLAVLGFPLEPTLLPTSSNSYFNVSLARGDNHFAPSPKENYSKTKTPSSPSATKPASPPPLSVAAPSPSLFSSRQMAQTPENPAAMFEQLPEMVTVVPRQSLSAVSFEQVQPAFPPALQSTTRQIATTVAPPEHQSGETDTRTSTNKTAATASFTPATIARYAFTTVVPYPPQARANGWEGTVLLRLTVDRKGRPREIRIADSSGYDLLDRTARNEVALWRFHPATEGMGTIEQEILVPVNFRLDAP